MFKRYKLRKRLLLVFFFAYIVFSAFCLIYKVFPVYSKGCCTGMGTEFPNAYACDGLGLSSDLQSDLPVETDSSLHS